MGFNQSFNMYAKSIESSSGSRLFAQKPLTAFSRSYLKYNDLTYDRRGTSDFLLFQSKQDFLKSHDRTRNDPNASNSSFNPQFNIPQVCNPFNYINSRLL